MAELSLVSDDGPIVAKKPLIPSVLTADKHMRAWLAVNDLSTIYDFDGHIWQLKVKGSEKISQNDFAVFWRAEVWLQTRVTLVDLYATQVLNKQSDSRLGSLIGADQVELKMKSKIYESPSIEKVRYWLSAEIEALRRNLKQSQLKGMKRALISDWVNRKMLFSQPF